MFSSYSNDQALEFGIDKNGSQDNNHWEAGEDLCEAVFNGVMTLSQVEAMMVETVVDKARGNLPAAARLLGLTRPQLAYRLGRLQENGHKSNDESSPTALSTESPR